MIPFDIQSVPAHTLTNITARLYRSPDPSAVLALDTAVLHKAGDAPASRVTMDFAKGCIVVDGGCIRHSGWITAWTQYGDGTPQGDETMLKLVSDAGAAGTNGLFMYGLPGEERTCVQRQVEAVGCRKR